MKKNLKWCFQLTYTDKYVISQECDDTMGTLE